MASMASSSPADQYQVLTVGPLDLFARLLGRLDQYHLDQPRVNRLKIAPKNEEEASDSYELTIDTKYYTTSKTVRVVNSWPADGRQGVEAVLVLFDPVLFEASPLETFGAQLEEDTLRILVSPAQHRDHDLTKKLKEEFDFIEYCIDLGDKDHRNGQTGNEDEEEANDQEEFEDLINSFFVHQWSDMDLVKQAPNQFQIKKGAEDLNTDGFKETENAVVAQEQATSSESEQHSKTARDASDDQMEENDDFEHLLMNLKDMKLKAEGLSSDERKKYAENVVLNFWRAIGGNEEEIGDLGDDLSDLDD